MAPQSLSTLSTVDEIIGVIETDLKMQKGVVRNDWVINSQIDGLWLVLGSRLKSVGSSFHTRLGPGIHCELFNAGIPVPLIAAGAVFNQKRSLYLKLVTQKGASFMFFDFGLPQKLHGLGVAFASYKESPTTEQSKYFFLINYRESEDDLEARFSAWLEERLRQGLLRWRDTLDN